MKELPLTALTPSTKVITYPWADCDQVFIHHENLWYVPYALFGKGSTSTAHIAVVHPERVPATLRVLALISH